MSSRFAAPVSKAASATARSISNTAQAARPNLALRAGYNANPLRQHSQAEETAAGTPEASRSLTTSSIGAPHRPLSSAPTRRPPMQGFRFIASDAAKQPPTSRASRHVDCAVLPRLSAAPSSSVAPFARMVHIPYLPAKGSAPVFEAPYAPVSAAAATPAAAAAATADGASASFASAPSAGAGRSRGQAQKSDEGEAAAAEDETVFVAAANPSAVAPMTEIEGIGADGVELFASGVPQQPRGWREPGVVQELWRGLVTPAVLMAGQGAGSTPSRSGAVPA